MSFVQLLLHQVIIFVLFFFHLESLTIIFIYKGIIHSSFFENVKSSTTIGGESFTRRSRPKDHASNHRNGSNRALWMITRD